MQPNMSPIQLATQLYELNASMQPFQIFVGFQDYPQLDQGSPHVAVAVAREVQNHCVPNNGQNPNPIRINAFNVISENAYTNDIFAPLVRYVLVRIYMGIRNGEYQEYISAANAAVPYMVRYFSAWLATKNTMVTAGLEPAIMQNVNRDAMLWERQMQMIAGQLPFEPFANQMLNDTLGAFNPLGGYGGNPNDMSNSGAFVPGAHAVAAHNQQYRQNANNASPGENRFTRQLHERKAMLAGSMQHAMVNAGMAGDAYDNARWDQALAAQRARSERAGMQGSNLHAAMQSMEAQPAATAAVANIAAAAAASLQKIKDEAPKPQEFIFEQLMSDGKKYGVIRMVRYADRQAAGVVWQSTAAQRMHPAWDPSCQDLMYFELENGQWAAVIEEGKDMTEKLFDYAAHAINPNLGFPEPEVPVAPATPEAKVEFAAAKAPRNINIAVTGRISQELDEESLITAAARKVKGMEVTPEAYLNQGNVIELVTFESADKMMLDLEAANSLVVASNFQSAIGMLPGIENEKLRNLIDEKLTKATNDWLANQAGMPAISIDKFSEDAAELEGYLRGPDIDYALMADKLKSSMQTIVASAYKALNAVPFKDVLESVYGAEYTDERLERSMVVMTNSCALWLNRDEQSLNVQVPVDQPCAVNKKHLPYLHAIALCAFGETDKALASKVSHITLVLADGKRYILSESCLSTPENRVFFITRKSS